MTAVLASVQTVDDGSLGLYAAAAVTFVVIVATYCVCSVVAISRLSAWRQRRQARRAQR